MANTAAKAPEEDFFRSIKLTAEPSAKMGSSCGRAGHVPIHLEKQLSEAPVITVPSITLEGDANGAPHPEPTSYAKKFSAKYAHRVITGGVGHNLPQEAPQAFTDAVIEVDRY